MTAVKLVPSIANINRVCFAFLFKSYTQLFFFFLNQAHTEMAYQKMSATECPGQDSSICSQCPGSLWLRFPEQVSKEVDRLFVSMASGWATDC